MSGIMRSRRSRPRSANVSRSSLRILARYVVEEIGVGELRGVLVRPEQIDRPPVALIVAGSGPTDRDGNNPAFTRDDMLRLLAEGLSARGIASVRLEKRGIGASRVEGLREEDVTLEDFVDDLERVAVAVMSRGDLGPFVLVGHSEGALISTLLSRRRQPDGLVLVSAPGRPLGEVMQEQLEARLPETLRPVALGLLAQLKAGQLVTDVPRELLALFRPSVQPFLISALCVNPAEHVKAVDAPVLIVSGEHDLQVTAEDHTQLTAARPEASAVRIAAMNHALRAAPPDPAGNAALYGRADLPLAPGLVDTIAKFISALPNSARPAAAHAACDR